MRMRLPFWPTWQRGSIMTSVKIDPVSARELKERLLSMCTHDCGAFISFRYALEAATYSPQVAEKLNKLVTDFNQFLSVIGAKTNEEL